MQLHSLIQIQAIGPQQRQLTSRRRPHLGGLVRSSEGCASARCWIFRSSRVRAFQIPKFSIGILELNADKVLWIFKTPTRKDSFARRASLFSRTHSIALRSSPACIPVQPSCNQQRLISVSDKRRENRRRR